MPQRSNLFQKVVRVLHQEIASDATVEESGFLIDSDTGEEREVDVVIETITAGHKLIVAIEATAAGRKADVGWVEQMLKKHDASFSSGPGVLRPGPQTLANRAGRDCLGASGD